MWETTIILFICSTLHNISQMIRWHYFLFSSNEALSLSMGIIPGLQKIGKSLSTALHGESHCNHLLRYTVFYPYRTLIVVPA
jgi:hypothetical protein